MSEKWSKRIGAMLITTLFFACVVAFTLLCFAWNGWPGIILIIGLVVWLVYRLIYSILYDVADPEEF